jgi:hypothetical protein
MEMPMSGKIYSLSEIHHVGRIITDTEENVKKL